jgi:hypothetical protein
MEKEEPNDENDYRWKSILKPEELILKAKRILLLLSLSLFLLYYEERFKVHNMHSSIVSETVTSDCPSRTTTCKRTPVSGLYVETPARGVMSLPSVELSAGISV